MHYLNLSKKYSEIYYHLKILNTQQDYVSFCVTESTSSAPKPMTSVSTASAIITLTASSTATMLGANVD